MPTLQNTMNEHDSANEFKPVKKPRFFLHELWQWEYLLKGQICFLFQLVEECNLEGMTNEEQLKELNNKNKVCIPIIVC